MLRGSIISDFLDFTYRGLEMGTGLEMGAQLRMALGFPCAALVLGVMGFPFIKPGSCSGSTRPRRRANVRGWSPTRPSATAWSPCRPVRKSMAATHRPAGHSTGQGKSKTAAVAPSDFGLGILDFGLNPICVRHSAIQNRHSKIQNG